MKHLPALLLLIALASIAALSMPAATNLNSSRSNIYRIVWAPDIGLTQAQGDALAGELEKLGAKDESTLKTWFANNFRRIGIQQTKVKKISVLLSRPMSCREPATACKGTYRGHSMLGASDKTAAACLCFGALTTQAQVREVNKATPIVIFLLSDASQQDDAFAMAVNLNSSKSN